MRRLVTCILVLLLTACAAPKYTIDDGRQVNETLLGHIRSYGEGERALRPAISRSAALHDVECDTQWELPFSVASSAAWSEDDRVAWVRGLGVDERLTVVATANNSPVKVGDRLKDIAGYSREDAEKMSLELAERRDAGKPFSVTLFTGKVVRVEPFKACRGYARLAPPNSPTSQDYHWLLSVHPLEIAQTHLTDDEALWLVLWTQGVSEEGGARMKTYHYGSKVVGTLYNLFTIASGIKGAAVVVEQAAQTVATSVATELVKRQLIEQATSLATARLRDEAIGVARKLSAAQVMGAMQVAAANRGSLTGVAWVAQTIFDRADAWAYNRLEKLNADPLAGFSLHQKLMEQSLLGNSMVLDVERLTALNKLADAQGKGPEVLAILQGIKPQDLQVALEDMPVASAPSGFSYEDPLDTFTANQPFARGLVDGLLNMPVASASTK